MKLVTFVHDGQTRLGALSGRGDRIIDLARADPRLPSDMLAFLHAGSAAFAIACVMVNAPPPAAVLDRAAVTLRAPIPRPGKIICVGQNYLEHARESGAAASPFPMIFAKWANAVIGPGEPIVIPPAVTQPDCEGELAAVIGRPARDVPEGRALDYVAGYMPFNDVSARDWQGRAGQWGIGKTPDTFAPMGPALVTADEVADPQNLTLRTVLNGQVLQQGWTGNMIFSVARLIADMTRVLTLEPGDVIATGTPGGVGAARTPPRWLAPGDVVRVEIDGIGVLENPVAARG